ncbi:MAG: hypothetical protein WEA34_07060 [Gemmatimonadota bacterium]
MPPSRFVSSDRLLRMVVFLTSAVVLLVGLDIGLRALGSSQAARLVLVAGWLVLLPLIGWRVWKGSAGGP